ncbi:ExeM/NucH family extracellular endonuclease [Aerosakkonemataceae cyanobacterium BLCC-F154]|uniref:ExeM/NucH family extracellular endonuclease n=1 Tax=Floridaenema fluviatile BLCC-F154 TaxID=3153640 RepID=A0ABV4Y7G6_9CYAN
MADLFFSKYIEGSSFNKALEIYNGTGSAVDLAAENYVVEMYFNGSTNAGLIINLMGTVANGDVFVLAHSSANQAILDQADQTNSFGGWFNGDDAIVLKKGGASGTIVDSIGQIGLDPGTEWGTELISTADNTLRRKSSVITGDSDSNNIFDPSSEWEGFANNTFDGLGSHTIAAVTPTIAIATIDANAAETGNDPGTFRITRIGDTTNALTVNYAVATGSGQATNGTDYNPNLTGTATIAAGQSFVDITFTPVDDAIIEINETVTITLLDSTDYNLGANIAATVAIVDNDLVTKPDLNPGISTPGPLTVGTAFNYTLDIQNNGNDNASGIELTFTLPANVTYNSANIFGGGFSSPTINGSTLTFIGGSINAGTFAKINVNVTPTQAGILGGTTLIADPNNNIAESNETNNSITTADFTVNAIPGVTITQSSGNTNVVEGGATDTYTVVLNTQPTADVIIAINSDSQTTINPTNLTFNNSNWNTPQTVTITAVDDPTVEGNHTNTINHTATSSDNNYNGISITPFNVSITDNDIETQPDLLTKISAIQGSGATSPLVGTTQTIEGIVVGDFQTPTSANGLGGFFLQEEAIDQDGNSLTSEGIFVFADSNFIDVSEGQKIRVTGTISETFGQTQITPTNAAAIQIQTGGSLTQITPATVNLPFASSSFAEQFEGMRINFSQTLTVSDTFELVRFGEITLSNGRLWQPTNIVNPGVAANSQQAANNLNQIILDDGRNGSYQTPFVYGFNATNPIRTGQTVTNIEGVLTEAFNDYRIHPTINPTFTGNLRTNAPENVGGNIKVASFNLLNYFNGPNFPTARGASNSAEFTRQRNKTIDAILKMNTDIIGLMELENDGYGSDSAIQDLVNGLNSSLAKPNGVTYSFIKPSFSQFDSDEITVGLIYNSAKVTPVGNAAILNTGAFAQGLHRLPLAQTFQDMATGGKFTVAVNHFKSKGSDPEAGDPNTDQGDGQGAWNLARTQAANELTAWLATDPTNSGDSDFLIIGDLNSYAKEDPITAIEAQGFTNLIAKFVGQDAYSFNFQGQAGYLDHALSSNSLTSQVTGATEWHINADEHRLIDYNQENLPNSALAKPADFYNVDPYRSSDHDPVVIGLSLTVPSSTAILSSNGCQCEDLEQLVNNSYNGAIPESHPPDDLIVGNDDYNVFFGGIGNDSIFGGSGDDLIFGNQDRDFINGNKGDDLIFAGKDNDFVRGGQDNDLLLGDLGNDTICGDRGNDSVFGMIGDDVLLGSEGDDFLNGNLGKDTVSGGEGNDIVRGGQDDDKLSGNGGNDTLFGDFGNDSICGCEGDDLIFGGAGNDTLGGGAGRDIFGLISGAGSDVIVDFVIAEDRLGLTSGLSSPSLIVSQGTGVQVNDTLIRVATTGELLVSLVGVSASAIASNQLITI